MFLPECLGYERLCFHPRSGLFVGQGDNPTDTNNLSSIKQLYKIVLYKLCRRDIQSCFNLSIHEVFSRSDKISFRNRWATSGTMS